MLLEALMIFIGRYYIFIKQTYQEDTDIQQTNSKFVGSTLEYRNPLNISLM